MRLQYAFYMNSVHVFLVSPEIAKFISFLMGIFNFFPLPFLLNYHELYSYKDIYDWFCHKWILFQHQLLYQCPLPSTSVPSFPPTPPQLPLWMTFSIPHCPSVPFANLSPLTQWETSCWRPVLLLLVLVAIGQLIFPY